jgi:integrase
VSELGIREQEALIAKMRARYSAVATKRYFGSVAAAIRWAAEREIITSHRPLVRHLSGGAPRDRVLSVAELAALWDAAEAEHLRAFIMTMLCTGARPGAVFELTRFAVDLERSLVRLNPPGREQGKKRRPILPLVSHLRPWVEIAEGHIVQFAGKPIRSVKTIWRETRLKAKLSADICPMVLRHTVATELARRGVSDFERQCWMGYHASNTTDRNYVHVKPDFLREAAEAVEELVNGIGRVAARPIHPINPIVRVKCVRAI